MAVNLQEFVQTVGRKKTLSALGYRNMGDGTIRNQSWCKDCQ